MRSVFALLVITVLQVSSLNPGNQKPTRYDNFAVYKVFIRNPEQRHVIENLLNHTSRYNLWRNGREEMHIMIHPEELSNFRRIMSQEGILTELLIPNVQALIDAERNS